MNKIVITGALGHIGSKLIRILPQELEDIEIVMIDNMLCQRYCSLFDLPKGYKYRFIEGDILTIDLNEVFKDALYVVHLAAITNAAGSFENQEEVEQVNYVGTKKVVDACIKNFSKLIFLSTTSVYGTQNEKVDEDCTLDELKPQSPYADSKLRSEELLQSLSHQLEYVILRFGTICGYSEGMRFHTAVNKFCWQAVMKQPVTIWKTAYEQKRPYLELNDAIRALCFIIENNIFNGEVYNILTLNATVREVIECIKYEVNDFEIKFVEEQIMNQLSYNVSNDKFQRLGFEFNGNLAESIKATIDKIRVSNGQ